MAANCAVTTWCSTARLGSMPEDGGLQVDRTQVVAGDVAAGDGPGHGRRTVLLDRSAGHRVGDGHRDPPGLVGRLHRVTQDDDGAPGPGHGALDQHQLAFRVGGDHLRD